MSYPVSAKWNDLPEDLAHKIFSLLGRSEDHISFVQVCSRWRTVYFQNGTLDLSHYRAITNQQLTALVDVIAQKGKLITSLNLNGCFLINEEGLNALKKFSLISCNLENCRVDFQFLKALKSHSSLKQLNLPGLYRTSSYPTLDQIPKEEWNPFSGFDHVERMYRGQRKVFKEN